jgi:hypothetical protein
MQALSGALFFVGVLLKGVCTALDRAASAGLYARHPGLLGSHLNDEASILREYYPSSTWARQFRSPATYATIRQRLLPELKEMCDSLAAGSVVKVRKMRHRLQLQRGTADEHIGWQHPCHARSRHLGSRNSHCTNVTHKQAIAQALQAIRLHARRMTCFGMWL